VAEDKTEKGHNISGGMLGSSDFLQLVILDNVDQAKKDFWKREFEKHGRNFIISPFNPKCLTPFSYDLSVGDQVYSCNRMIAEDTKVLPDETYWMSPRETVVIKTKEFIALTPHYSATVWPRFKMPVEAIFQSMVKIDPTWYGELGVAITNLSSGMYPIKRGELFATLILYELKTPTRMFLYRKENLPDPKQVQLPENDNIKVESIKEKLEQKNLQDICEIDNRQVKLKECPDDKSLLELLGVSDSDEWKHAIIECIGYRPRKMDGLGLTTLEMIRPTPAQAKKLNKEDIQTTKCSETELENTAIEHGKPFNLLAVIPEWILQKVEKELVPRIEAEVGARLFPQIVQLTLRVLALLSLIGVAIALSAKYFDVQSTWLGVVAVSAIPLMLIFLIFMFGKYPRQKEIWTERKQSGSHNSVPKGNTDIEAKYRCPKLVSFVLRLLSPLKKK